MRRGFSIVLLFLFCGVVHGQGADAGLKGFYKNYLEEHFALRPLDATQLGDHRFDHLLEDVSKGAREKWRAHDRETLKELRRKIDYKKLSRAEQIDFEIFEHDLKRGS